MEIKPNNIYCGDCYELIKEIPDKSIDLIYTDIPYLHTVGGGGGHSEISKRIQKINNQELKDINKGIDYSILDEFVRVLKRIYIYVYCSKEQMLPLMEYFIKKYNCFFEVLVWCKTNAIPACNGTYLPDLEYCLMFREKGTKIGGTYQTKSKYFISSTNKEDKDLFLHPTCKNVDMITNHLINSSNEGDIILDPFCGSGSTLIAAKRLNRKYIGFEIDKKWYQVASDRLQGISAKGTMNLFDI